MSTSTEKQRPMCAVCRKLVDKMTREEDDHLERVVFTVECHGRRERVVLDRKLADNAKSITLGLAFNPGNVLPAMGG